MSVCVDNVQALPDDLFVSETSPAFRVQQSLFLPTCELSLSRGTEGATASWGWGPGSYSQQGGSCGIKVQAHLPADEDLSRSRCTWAGGARPHGGTEVSGWE